MGFPKERTFVHHIGIDLEKFPLRPPEMEENYILHVARLVEGKGTATLIRALSLLPERHKAIKIISIGGGPLRKKLEKLASDLGVRKNIQFLGPCPYETVQEWTARSAIAVLPSIESSNKWVEGLGLALVEAAACGLPVIGSDIGGIPEAMDAGKTGLLFPPGDPIALAKKIAFLLDDKALRVKMGQAGRAFVEKEFSKEKQNKKLEAIYDSLL
ncbi:glycosyl transferase [Lasius niger]|uniref:Glycosyl transferase n=1 Tax=Lasius niger TaxID=67767 RepID=A0A0J7KCE6_LASNI|nr:glycosyl transferase [Lasius niger]